MFCIPQTCFGATWVGPWNQSLYCQSYPERAETLRIFFWEQTLLSVFQASKVANHLWHWKTPTIFNSLWLCESLWIVFVFFWAPCFFNGSYGEGLNPLDLSVEKPTSNNVGASGRCSSTWQKITTKDIYKLPSLTSTRLLGVPGVFQNICKNPSGRIRKGKDGWMRISLRLFSTNVCFRF